MTTSELFDPNVKPDFSQLFIRFTANMLERDGTKVPGTPAYERFRGAFCVLVGLDGAGKTTLARNLCSLAAREPRFRGTRYFHWRPKVLKAVEFPLPEFRNVPRKQLVAKNFFNRILSVARLVKNVVLANIAYWLRLRPLVQRGCLVLVDRYFYNYYLDPASVKYAGPSWLLEVAQKTFPRPDVIITLRAPTEILLQRKQELSEVEIRRQAGVLEHLKFDAARVVVVDASQSAEEVARKTLAEISKTAP